jgi:hypothetical protein
VGTSPFRVCAEGIPPGRALSDVRSAPIEQEVAEADDSSNATSNAIIMETMENWQVAEAAERATRNYHRRADRAVRREEPLARLRTSMRERREASRVAEAASSQVW